MVYKTFSDLNRPKPFIYAQTQEDSKDADSWLIGPKRNDLITICSFAQGFEHNVVVLFQYKDAFQCNINSCMRSTGFLIVVKVSDEQLNKLCFGFCQSE